MKHNISTYSDKRFVQEVSCGFPDKFEDITFSNIKFKMRSETKWEKIKRKFLYYWKQL